MNVQRWEAEQPGLKTAVFSPYKRLMYVFQFCQGNKNVPFGSGCQWQTWSGPSLNLTRKKRTTILGEREDPL